MGIDSFLGEYACGDVEIHYDYGGWSNRLDAAAAEPGAIDETRVIGPFSARLVRWQQPDDPDGLTFHSAVYFERMLTFSLRGAEASAWELALRVFDTIRFP